MYLAGSQKRSETKCLINGLLMLFLTVRQTYSILSVGTSTRLFTVDSCFCSNKAVTRRKVYRDTKHDLCYFGQDDRKKLKEDPDNTQLVQRIQEAVAWRQQAVQ